ncbi:MAG: hypothetical protein JWO72_2733 [Caulobacteraceae bacterium]|nr:hypothetical protein [Caulobacteraceae bacterium]
MRLAAGFALALSLACASAARAQDAPADAAMSNMPGMDHGGMAGMKMTSPEVGMAGISGARGFYPFERDSSGSSWQPDASPRIGLRLPRGAWLFSFNSLLQAGYARLDGFQTTSQGFASSTLTAAGRRDLGNMDVFQLRARIRPNTAEPSTFANPRDRQPPSAIASELSASYSHRINFTDTVFAYAAAVGQPALGPPVYSDRQSSGDSPLAPIFVQRPEPAEAAGGVVTGGWVHGDWKLEGSGFKGRAPRPDRLMTPDLDSWSVRLSVNPAKAWALQTSWAVLTSPNSQLPAINPAIWSASAIHTRPLGVAGWWSTAASFTHITARQLSAPMNDWLLESAVSDGGDWTAFARAEQGELRALTSPRVPVQTVRKLSFGAVRDWSVREHAKLGLGALYALGGPSAALKAAYGPSPNGAMVFLRLKLG